MRHNENNKEQLLDDIAYDGELLEYDLMEIQAKVIKGLNM